MENLKIVKIDSNFLYFDNGMTLYSDHNQDCCENHYLDFSDLTLDDFNGLEFNLSNDNFFERIEDYGISLNPINGYPVRIPGYGSNNGYYSSDLALIITNTNGRSTFKKYDITECQDYNIN